MYPEDLTDDELKKLSTLVNDGATLDDLAEIVYSNLDTQAHPELASLSDAALHDLARLSMTSLLAYYWNERLTVEVNTTRANKTASWRILARLTGYPSADAVRKHFWDINRTPSPRRYRATKRRVPSLINRP